MAIPAGQIMRHFGYKSGLVTGLILMGSGCWLFWPAAHADMYSFFVAAQFVIGCGLSFWRRARIPLLRSWGRPRPASAA